MIAALGAFDGFHKGHQALLKEARKLSDFSGEGWGVVTLTPHPQLLFSPRSPGLLFTEQERHRLCRFLFVPQYVRIPFTKETAALSPEEFLDAFLVPCGIRGIVVGNDFRFGKDRSGNVAFLERESWRRGWFFAALEQMRLRGAPVSSTRVRHALLEGDLAETADLLGYPFFVSGPVVRGDGRGRILGFPTANVAIPAIKLLPPNGVYAGVVFLNGKRHVAAVNIGINPTFPGVRARRFEVHILECDADLYDRVLSVFLLQRLRAELPFSGPAELIAKVKEDVATARRVTTLLSPEVDSVLERLAEDTNLFVQERCLSVDR
jgi:riboflavin kinase/FMN adenylyltransferase